MRAGIALVGLGLLAGAVASWCVGSLLSAPAARAIGPSPASLGAEEVAFESSSGSRLHGWVLSGTAGGGVVILAHSVRSNRLEMVGRAEFLRSSGYSLLAFDQQAHGESPGKIITFGYLESRDARAAVAYARSRWPRERLAYLGVSQGGAAALIGPEPLDVEALILEAVYPTLREAVTDRLAIRVGPLAGLIAPLLLVQTRMRLGVDADALSPIEGITRLRAPLLLIAGGRDRHTSLAESERMFYRAPEPKELWILPGAAHQNFHAFAPREYQQRVLGFLAKYLRAETVGPMEGQSGSVAARGAAR